MNANDIKADGPLARALDDYRVPALSPDFAGRVLAACATRPAPLPQLRQTGGRHRWRLGRRIALSSLCFGALATAAAATGVLERFDIPVPSPQKVWASIAGKQPAPLVEPMSSPALAAAPASEIERLGPVVIEGAIDTPEELQETFRRIEEVRQGRAQARSQRIDQRIATAIERRRAAGQSIPTPEEEARLRQRIAEAQARRDQAVDERLKARREEFARRLESGEALTREDIVQPLRDDQRMLERRERIERLRQMSPEQRREALRRLPPEQRRALIDGYRARRGAAQLETPVVTPADPEATPLLQSADEENVAEPRL